MRTCIIVDDDFPQIRLIRNLVAKRTDIKCVNSFVDPLKAIEYLKTNSIDIAFLDIQMQEIDGIKMSTFLPSNTQVIYITSSPKHALEAFNVNAIDYLLKPVLNDRFNKSVDKAIQLLNFSVVSAVEVREKRKQFITIICDRKAFKINVDDIFYIESKMEYVCYYTSNGKYLSLATLKELTTKLPENIFVRVHRSYIVNVEYVSSFNYTNVIMTDNKNLLIGRSYNDNFKKVMYNK